MPRVQSRLTVASVEKAIGLVAPRWAGNCYFIACKVVEAGLVDGTAVYGHYLGKVHPNSMFAHKGPFVRHGWVALANGGVFDPTRWVFEHVAPYLFRARKPGPEYDEGGNQFLAKVAGDKPPPVPEDDKLQAFFAEDLPPDTWMWLMLLLKLNLTFPVIAVPLRHVFWLGNLPLERLGEHAKPIYEAFAKRGHIAKIPIDNYNRVMSGRWP